MTRALVVGAGSAGLAAAVRLQRDGLEVLVLEGGDRIGNSWHHRYLSLRLNTLRALSGLPGLRLPRSAGNWVGGPDFATYLERYAAHHRLEVRTGRAARRVRPAGHGQGWQVDTADGVETAAVLVVATGHAGVPRMPEVPRGDEVTVPVLHSARYRVPEPFTGRRVLVIGSGNSATEIATDLVGHATRVWLAIRTPPLLVPTRRLGISAHRLSVLGVALPDRFWDAAGLLGHRLAYGGLSRHGLPVPGIGSHSRFRATGEVPVAERGFAGAVRERRIEVVSAVTAFDGDRVWLEGDAVLRPDAVIAATGYRPSYPRLLGDLAVLTGGGRPRAWAGPLPGAPGLFVVGAPSLQGDLREHGRESFRVGAAVRGLLGRPTRERAGAPVAGGSR